jgi:hypothetical protein
LRSIARAPLWLAVVAFGLLLIGAAAGPAAGQTAQDGERNFAGPASMCPGSDWNCTSTFPVAQSGTENVIVCVGDTAACAGSTQTGDVNKIECTSEVKNAAASTQSIWWWLPSSKTTHGAVRSGSRRAA